MAQWNLLPITLLFAVLCHSQVRASPGARHLTQAAGNAPSCYWLEAEKMCVPSYQNMLAVTGASPSNVFRKAYMMALDRSDKCSKTHTTEAKCMADAANRCFWRKVQNANGICLSADYAEVTAFEASAFTVDVATVPSSMTCPGTKANQFFSCYAHPAPDVCAKLPGCAVAPASLTNGKPVCLPKWAATLDKRGSDALAAQLKALDPALFGSCEAVCWLKQARTCTASSANQSACEKNAQCVYNIEAKVCLRAQVAKPGKDAYDDKLSALMNGCGKLTSKAACTAKAVKLEQAGKWVAWKAASAQAKC